MILLEDIGTQEVPAVCVFLDKSCGTLTADFWTPYFLRMNLNGNDPVPQEFSPDRTVTVCACATLGCKQLLHFTPE